MVFKDYLKHYLSMPGILFFFLISFAIVFLIFMILLCFAGRKACRYRKQDRVFAMEDLFKIYTERYYELMFSATSTLFFTGIYFLIDFDYFHMSARAWSLWEQYNDFILLGFLVMSIILINLLDHLIIPLGRIKKAEIGSLRLAGMVYMLIIFAYIKFIYQDNNYDIIIFYFLSMVVGRFVYLDASWEGFAQSVRDMSGILPILCLVLLSTALLALYGFGSQYLLKANGVVVSLFLAHCFVIFEIFILSVTGIPHRLTGLIARRIHG